ncbi:organic cation transporter protein-like [Octopus sinensis]|uniref:Organic cation transporter protein-like n=1 Tax=Octopus sinensis TaxID=2607531 RepID=A0A6P7SZT8_9MOLL|nr:organic cation transporter protein-like [Octopus sinensis]
MENMRATLKETNGMLAAHGTKDLSVSQITEEIFKKCGGYGLFQKKLTLLVLIYMIIDAYQFLTMAFIREKVPFACYPSNFNESMIPLNTTLDEFLNEVTVKEEKCSVYNLDTKEGFYILPTGNSTEEPCNNGRKFYIKDRSSIVSEFDLVCEKEWMRNIAVSSLFAGLLLGHLLVGVCSDKFGRFKTFFVGEIIYSCFSIAKIHSPDYTVFVVMYFFEGLGQAGTYIILFTILLECVTQNYKMRLNFLMHGTFALGEILLAGVAYALRKWQHLLYATCIPHIVIFFTISKFLPESPRWLLNKGRFTEAEKSFSKIAKMNKKDDEDVIDLVREFQMEAEREHKLDVEVVENKNLGNKKGSNKTYTAIDLLKRPRRAMITTNIWFNWFVNSMVYYGVTLNSVDMSGDRYLNFLLVSTIEIPASILGCLMFNWFGHRKPIVFFMVFGGINCIVSNFLPKGNFWFPLVLTVLGKLGATASFDGVYLLSAELFPTTVRNSGSGAGSSFAKVGAILSPIILGLSVYGSWVPLSVYGVFGITAGLLILLLPEMKDACLLQTLEDMDNL